jgi:phosphoglucosamine mutase
VLSDYTTTGDGLIAALQVLAVLVGTQQPASRALSVFEPVPQKLTSVRVADRTVLEDARAQDAIAATERELADQGRLVIRASGTEPKIRVMAEADDAGLVTRLVDRLSARIREIAEDRVQADGARRAAE